MPKVCWAKLVQASTDGADESSESSRGIESVEPVEESVHLLSRLHLEELRFPLHGADKTLAPVLVHVGPYSPARPTRLESYALCVPVWKSTA